MEKKQVRLEQLWDAMATTERIVVKHSPLADSAVLFESSADEDVRELRSCLSLVPPPEWQHCMCVGSPAVYLESPAHETVLITNHHAQAIRCSLWDSDVPILDQESWLAWFDQRGISGPRDEVEAARSREREWDIARERWFAAMPDCLRPLWGDEYEFGGEDLSPFFGALRAEVPDLTAQILLLFEWYGSGEGPWSGHPAYEVVAEEMLLEYPTELLISAASVQTLSERQVEGAARLLGGWLFSKQRPGDRESVPRGLKQRLWAAVKDTPLPDKRQRAERAFLEG